MFAHRSRRLGMLVTVGAALWVAESYPSRVKADPCNDKKAVYIGCPIPQQTCRDQGCGNLVTPCDTCWSVTDFYADYFGCGPPNINEWTAQKKWRCYAVWDVGPLGLYPVTRPCLDIVYCMKMGFICVSDPNNPDTLNYQIYGTTNNCELTS